MRNAGLDEAQAGIKIAKRNSNNLRYADDITHMAESEEELKSLLMKVKEESEKAFLELNIQKTKIMASGSNTSRERDGETVRDFIFLGSKITADGDCSHEIKILALWKKSFDKPRQYIKKQGLCQKKKKNVHLVKAVVFPVVMYECENRNIKKSVHQRIDISELWFWRRLLRVPWTVGGSNESILKETNPEYSLEVLMLKLECQFFGHRIMKS